MDAQEIKTAVAHQDAATRRGRGAVRQPGRPGPGAGRRRPPGRQPARPDLRGRARRAVERLALAALATGSTTSRRSGRSSNLTDEEREGLSAPDKFRVDITPYFISLIDPDDPNDPIRRQVIPIGSEHEAFTAMMEDSLAEDRHSPVPGPRPPLPGPGPDARHDAVRLVLPLLHAVADRRRPDPELQQPRPRGAARVPAPDPAGPRRPDLRRRRPDPRAQAVREDPARPARDPAHRDHPHRLARAGLPAAAHRRRAVRGPREVPPALDQPALQPPERDHARGLARGRQADQGRAAGRQPERAAGRRQRLRPHPALARPQARRQPDPAVLPLPVRPRRRLRALPDAGRQGPRDHGGPARPHVGLRGADLRDRCARRRRQDPGHAQLPDLVLGPQGRAAQLRGLHHDLRGARELPEARLGGLRVLPARAPGARPVRRARAARGRADVDRAEGLRGGPPARQHRGAPAPGPVASGCRSASARSRARPARRCA